MTLAAPSVQKIANKNFDNFVATQQIKCKIYLFSLLQNLHFHSVCTTFAGMKEKNLFRRYPYSTALIVLIWVLCLIPVFPETPLDNVSMIDKWTHIVMYAGLCLVIWGEYLWRNKKRRPNWNRLFLFGFMAPALMGGVIELAQAYCTFGYRSGEWLDWAADTIGAVVGAIIGMLLAACRAKARRDT